MRLLAFDAALRHTGWCLYEETPITVGLIKTSPKETESESLAAIHLAVYALITEHRPDMLVIEDQHFARNVVTLKRLAAVRGVLQAVAGLHGLSCLVLEPAKIKKAAAGSGRATKDDIETAVKPLVTDEIRAWVSTLPKQDDVWDAVAIAIAADKENTHA